jgi:AAA+ ATPase superfamily predicted ATPase
MFAGRHTELDKMNGLFEQGRFECVIVYGRRRIGKTRLINEFMAGKEGVYFSALESNAAENLELFSKSLLALGAGHAEPEASFADFHKALDYAFNLAKERRIVLAIDEYPYLAAACREISSILQDYIDRHHEHSRLFLILCGSSLSFMENQILGYQSPLFGRRTAQFKINPLEYYEMAEYFTRVSFRDLALVYGITGGVPQYMIKIDERRSIAQNIRDNFFDSAAYLFEEPVNLIKQECREPAQYNAIIGVIARGASKLSDIASKAGLTTGLCSNYLSTLLAIGIVKKETPFGEKTGKKTIYILADSMFKFWYRFMPDNMALIQKGQKDLVWDRVSPQIPAFMGSVFEEICKQWLWRENIAGRLPFRFTGLGRWWGNDPIRRQETEIDILAFGDAGEVLVGECKWTAGKTGIEVLRGLEDRAVIFQAQKRYFYLFAKDGFSKACIEEAEKNSSVKLVCFDKMR